MTYLEEITSFFLLKNIPHSYYYYNYIDFFNMRGLFKWIILPIPHNNFQEGKLDMIISVSHKSVYFFIITILQFPAYDCYIQEGYLLSLVSFSKLFPMD